MFKLKIFKCTGGFGLEKKIILKVIPIVGNYPIIMVIVIVLVLDVNRP